MNKTGDNGGDNGQVDGVRCSVDCECDNSRYWKGRRSAWKNERTESKMMPRFFGIRDDVIRCAADKERDRLIILDIC